MLEIEFAKHACKSRACDYYGLSVKIRQGMDKNGEITEALKAIKNVADNTSWFRDTPHYWASASLPLAYAVACVEVVSESSEKARILYNKPDVLEVDSYLLTTGRTWA
ncbi:MAG TPA: hypothetical protein VMW50_04850 [Dehalococcoidia bacterium]|nr:hypothetical protein [Dehalococcoidia bacterium]